MSGFKTLLMPDNNSDKLLCLFLIIASAIIVGNLINIGIRYQRGRQLKAVAVKVSLISPDKNVNMTKAADEQNPDDQESASDTHSDSDSCRELLLSEIEKELARVPKDIIVKGIAIVVTLLVIIAWLIFCSD